MSAATVATIDLAALQSNLLRVRTLAPNSRIMAVVKANAYGHGMVPVARALHAAEGLAVARVDEAVALRDAGIRKALLVMGGFDDAEGLAQCAQWDLEVAVHAPHQLELLEAHAGEAGSRLRVWLKLNTGMHRLGFPAEELQALYGRLARIPSVEVACIMTHFASADEDGNPFTDWQIRKFHAALGGVSVPRSLANSAAILRWPTSHDDWVRPGIMLYGASPFPGRTGEQDGLIPVMTFTSRLIAINEVEAGGRVGYGGVWTSPARSRIGVVAAGYGDGYPREAPNGTPVLVAGVRVPLVGRVSMDLLTVDLSAHPDAVVGDPVTLWGRGLPVEEIAGQVGTVAYAILTGISRRTRLVYVGGPGEEGVP